jgi:hypothetical protein
MTPRWSNRFKLARAIEDVDNQVALIRALIATWEQAKAGLVLAQQIDVVNYDPDKLPLFICLSVTPTVDLRSRPTGPNVADSFRRQNRPRDPLAQGHESQRACHIGTL